MNIINEPCPSSDIAVISIDSRDIEYNTNNTNTNTMSGGKEIDEKELKKLMTKPLIKVSTECNANAPVRMNVMLYHKHMDLLLLLLITGTALSFFYYLTVFRHAN